MQKDGMTPIGASDAVVLKFDEEVTTAGCSGSISLVAVTPSPATHAIFRLLKAGESVFQTFLLTKTMFYTYT